MSGAALMQEALRRFEVGLAVLIFPESTRSPPGGLHPFRRGAFELAVRAHVPLWPLLLTCDPPALSKGLPFWRQPDRVALLRVEPGDLQTDLRDARSACQAIEALFVEGLRVSSSATSSAQGSAAPQRAVPRAAPLALGLEGMSRDGTSHCLTTPPSADVPSAPPERGRNDERTSHCLTTPPSADVPSASPERGRTSDEASHSA